MTNNGNGKDTRFKPGQSGNPGGRPKSIERVVNLARENTEAGVKAIAKIMLDPKERGATRVAAFNALMDRAWGKAPQTITIDNMDNMTDAELEALITERKEYLATLESGACRASVDGDPEDDDETVH